MSTMSLEQTEIGTIHSLENFMQNFVLPTETVMVAHPVGRQISTTATIEDTSLTHVRLAAHSTTSPTPTAMEQ
jgi:hypothetical protein